MSFAACNITPLKNVHVICHSVMVRVNTAVYECKWAQNLRNLFYCALNWVDTDMCKLQLSEIFTSWCEKWGMAFITMECSQLHLHLILMPKLIWWFWFVKLHRRINQRLFCFKYFGVQMKTKRPQSSLLQSTLFLLALSNYESHRKLDMIFFSSNNKEAKCVGVPLRYE